MAHSDAREGKWRGNWRREWVASTLHTTSEHGVSSITTADTHASAASSRLNWRPRRFKLTSPFRRKTKSGFCACATTFHLASTYRIINPDSALVKMYYRAWHNSTFCPHSAFVCFSWIGEQRWSFPYTALTEWFFFITKTESVQCAVRDEYLNVTQVDLRLLQTVTNTITFQPRPLQFTEMG